MSGGYLIDDAFARELQAVVRRFRSMPIGGPADQTPPERAYGMYCEVLAGAEVDDPGDDAPEGRTFWNAKLIAWDKATADWLTGKDIWAIDLQDRDLLPGIRYFAKMVEHDRNLNGDIRALVVVVAYDAGFDDESSLGMGAAANCDAGSGTSRTISFQSTTCDVDGNPCTTTTTLTFPFPVQFCISSPDCP